MLWRSIDWFFHTTLLPFNTWLVVGSQLLEKVALMLVGELIEGIAPKVIDPAASSATSAPFPVLCATFSSLV